MGYCAASSDKFLPTFRDNLEFNNPPSYLFSLRILKGLN